MSATQQTKVGWIGLGAMGSGMAASLVSQGFPVKAFDVWAPSLEAAVKQGATAAASPVEAAQDVSVLALMVVNAKQVEDIVFGVHQIAHVLAPGSSIICFSTVPPSYLVTVQERLDSLGTGIGICDSPVSGGSTRAAQGTLTIMTSGTETALSTARPVLDALTRKPEGKLSVVGAVVGAASDFKLINQVCCACQIAMASESMAFGTKLGLNPRMLYNAIRTASGDSFMFGHRVPQQFKHSGVIASAMAIVTKDIGIVMDEARLNGFPAPVSAAVEQLFTTAAGAGMARADDGQLIQLWEKFGGVSPEDKGSEAEEIEKAKELSIEPNGKPNKVLFVGLGAMGAGMATAVQQAGTSVVGYDVSLEAMDRVAATGLKVSSDAVKEASDSDVVVLMPVTAIQAEAVLFGAAGQPGLTSSLPQQAVIILGSTVGPTACLKIQATLDQEGKGHQLVDAPVSGGPSRASTGDLAIMASGDTEALRKAASTLHALSTQAGRTQNLHFIPGGVGSGQKIKLVNNLLAGVHLAVAAEAFAFAVKKGMNLDAVFGVLANGAAYTYVMTDRYPRMKMANPPVHSAVDTFVKDLSIVLAEAKALNLPLWLAAAAHQQFVTASALGLGREDDASIIRLWEAYGVRVRGQD